MVTDKAGVLEGYVIKVLRIGPPAQGIYREAKTNEAVGSTSLNAGGLFYVDIAIVDIS